MLLLQKGTRSARWHFGAVMLLWLAATSVAGCCSHETMGVPSLLHPGDIDTQRAKMERFDPLPQTGFSPSIEGGRGRGFEHAIAPERRASVYRDTLVEGGGTP